MVAVRIPVYTDDMDGKTTLGEDDMRGVRFGFDGGIFELDITRARYETLRDFLAPYVEAARHVGKLPTAGPYAVSSTATPRTGPPPKLVRAWAISNGYELTDRGRIPQSIVRAYEARDSNPLPVEPAAPARRPAVKKPAAASKPPVKRKPVRKKPAAPATADATESA